MRVDLPPLRLYTHGLFSKFGFRDSCEISNWLDDITEKDMRYSSRMGAADDNVLRDDFPWMYDDKYFLKIKMRRVLHRLIEKYMMPELQKNHNIGELEWIGSSHNNSRVSTLEGEEISWYDYDRDLKLNPEYVEIKFADIIMLLIHEFGVDASVLFGPSTRFETIYKAGLAIDYIRSGLSYDEYKQKKNKEYMENI